MKKSFFANTIVLTLTTQLLRITGLCFIAFLTGKIGPEGIGLFQLISSVYFLASTFAISGVGVAVSRLTAESVGTSGNKTISNIVGRALIISLFIGIFAGLTFFLLSGFIGTYVLADGRSVLSLKTLSFALPFMAVTVSLRGYFFGLKKATAPAAQMIFEQAVQLIVLFSIIDSFVPLGLEYACFAIAISSVVSEALSFGFGFVMYAVQKSRSSLTVMRDSSINRKILGISVPVALSSYLRSGLRTAENVLIPSGLRRFGATESEALSQFGLLGMVMPILLFPSSFLTAVSALLLPEISEASALNDNQKVRAIFSKVFKITTVLSLLFSGIFAAFAGDFGVLIYKNKASGVLLMLLAPLLPLIYLDYIVDSMLCGLNQQTATLKINVLDYTLRIGLILFLIPRYGFAAYIAVFYASTMLNAFLSIRRLLIVSGSRIEYADWVIKPLLCVTIACLTTRILIRLTGYIELSAEALIIKISSAILLYTVFLFLTRCLGRSDIEWLAGVARKRKMTRAKYTSNGI